MSNTMRRAAAGLITAVAAGTLSMVAAAPAQAAPAHCAKYLHSQGYIVGPKVESACKTGGTGGPAGFEKCVTALVKIEVSKGHAQHACKLAGAN